MLENFTAGMYNEAKRWRNSYKLLVYRYYTILQNVISAFLLCDFVPLCNIQPSISEL